MIFKWFKFVLANSYEIRYHTNGTKLLLSPKDAWQVTKENVVRGKLDRPKEAGQIEHVAIQFPHTMKWTAIMLRSVDQHNSAGEFSNMVTALFELWFIVQKKKFNGIDGKC